MPLSHRDVRPATFAVDVNQEDRDALVGVKRDDPIAAAFALAAPCKAHLSCTAGPGDDISGGRTCREERHDRGPLFLTETFAVGGSKKPRRFNDCLHVVMYGIAY